PACEASAPDNGVPSSLFSRSTTAPRPREIRGSERDRCLLPAKDQGLPGRFLASRDNGIALEWFPRQRDRCFAKNRGWSPSKSSARSGDDGSTSDLSGAAWFVIPRFGGIKHPPRRCWGRLIDSPDVDAEFPSPHRRLPAPRFLLYSRPAGGGAGV